MPPKGERRRVEVREAVTGSQSDGGRRPDTHPKVAPTECYLSDQQIDMATMRAVERLMERHIRKRMLRLRPKPSFLKVLLSGGTCAFLCVIQSMCFINGLLTNTEIGLFSIFLTLTLACVLKCVFALEAVGNLTIISVYVTVCKGLLKTEKQMLDCACNAYNEGLSLCKFVIKYLKPFGIGPKSAVGLLILLLFLCSRVASFVDPIRQSMYNEISTVWEDTDTSVSTFGTRYFDQRDNTWKFDVDFSLLSSINDETFFREFFRRCSPLFEPTCFIKLYKEEYPEEHPFKTLLKLLPVTEQIRKRSVFAELKNIVLTALQRSGISTGR